MLEKPATADTLTVYELADLLRISRTHAYRLCQTGRIPSLRIGRSVRLRRSDVERVMAEGVDSPEGGSAR